jgi:hypothetical protein
MEYIFVILAFLGSRKGMLLHKRAIVAYSLQISPSNVLEDMSKTANVLIDSDSREEATNSSA